MVDAGTGRRVGADACWVVLVGRPFEDAGREVLDVGVACFMGVWMDCVGECCRRIVKCSTV